MNQNEKDLILLEEIELLISEIDSILLEEGVEN